MMGASMRNEREDILLVLEENHLYLVFVDVKGRTTGSCSYPLSTSASLLDQQEPIRLDDCHYETDTLNKDGKIWTDEWNSPIS
jgi:hypothetical protein